MIERTRPLANPELRSRTDYELAARATIKGDITALSDKGLNTNAVGPQGAIALMWASMLGNTKAMSILMERGADPYLKDREGNDSFYYAKLGMHKDAIYLLESKKTATDIRELERA